MKFVGRQIDLGKLCISDLSPKWALAVIQSWVTLVWLTGVPGRQFRRSVRALLQVQRRGDAGRRAVGSTLPSRAGARPGS